MLHLMMMMIQRFTRGMYGMFGSRFSIFKKYIKMKYVLLSLTHKVFRLFVVNKSFSIRRYEKKRYKKFKIREAK